MGRRDHPPPLLQAAQPTLTTPRRWLQPVGGRALWPWGLWAPRGCGPKGLWTTPHPVPWKLWAWGAAGRDQTDGLCSAFAVPGGARPAGDPVPAGVCVAPGHAHPEGVSWRGDHPSGHMGLRRQHNTVFLLVSTEGQGEVWFGTGLPHPHHENKTPFSKGLEKTYPGSLGPKM